MSYIKEKPCDKQNTATDHCRRFFFGLDLTNHIKHQFVFAFAILKKMKSLIDGVNSSLYLFLDMFVCFFFILSIHVGMYFVFFAPLGLISLRAHGVKTHPEPLSHTST